jgi:hypothetical protein
MSAAMINVSLMKKGQFSIRNKTTYGYACVSGMANGGALSRDDRNFNSRNTMKINCKQT